MKEYWYSLETKHLYADDEMTGPFLCPVEVTPLRFESSAECSEYLQEHGIEGSVMYKLPVSL